MAKETDIKYITPSETKLFTLFGKGNWSKSAQKYVPSTKPIMNVDIPWTGSYIISERAKPQTLELRQMMGTVTEQQLRDYKLLQFDAVAAAGIFSYGNASGLTIRSPYIVLDIDDLESTEVAREIQQTLIADKNIETALCFLSPKGVGVKWLAELPEWCQNSDDVFKLQVETSTETDSGTDVTVPLHIYNLPRYVKTNRTTYDLRLTESRSKWLKKINNFGRCNVITDR